jgi:hypothetical protein
MASSSGRSAESQWRVQDGAWHLDVRLGAGVTYDDATAIVRAVRRRELDNRIPAALRRILNADPLPTFDASEIRSIRMSGQPGDDETHEVILGGWAGQVLYVSVVGGKVRVHNIGSHIS